MSKMLVCKFLDRKQVTLSLLKGETVLEFCERMSHASDLPPLLDDTSAFVIIQNGKIINRTDYRHRRLEDCADVTKYFCTVLTQLSNPSTIAMVKGNLEKNEFNPDLTECCICMNDFWERNGRLSSQMMFLPCRHRFHKVCLVNPKLEIRTCPLCREPFDPDSV